MKVLFNSRGQSVNIDADTSMTVAAFKDELQGPTGINPQFQELVCGGKKLRNGQTLNHYKLTNESTIEVHVHMNGGCAESCGCCGCSEGCSCSGCSIM